jgi:hypothetical protein
LGAFCIHDDRIWAYCCLHKPWVVVLRKKSFSLTPLVLMGI